MKFLEKTSLVKREREAIEAAVHMLKSQFSVEKVILFGSKARRDYDEHSDIDLLLITSRRLHWKEEKAAVEALFDIGMEYDVLFSPLFASADEWDGGLFTEFPIYDEIIKDGAIVA
jgi:predicted nucleotidyltransferase